MCMYNCRTERDRSVKSRAWKIMEYDPDMEVWQTPYNAAVPDGKRLVARGRPSFSYRRSDARLYGGAIHCFRDRDRASREVPAWFRWDLVDIFEVNGYGYVAHNDHEVAFRSVTFIDNPDDWEI